MNDQQAVSPEATQAFCAEYGQKTLALCEATARIETLTRERDHLADLLRQLQERYGPAAPEPVTEGG